MSMRAGELRKAISNSLYVGLMVTFFGGFFSTSRSVLILVLAVSIVVIIGSMVRLLPYFSGVSEEIHKLQKFLLVALLFVVIFWNIFPLLLPRLQHTTSVATDTAIAGFHEFSPALSIFLEFAPPALSLAGLIVAFFGLKK